jgi:outer membrane scaffolding protein for murein synthesis (MipA/OmpV family)
MASLRTTIAIAACCLACAAHAQSRDDDKYLGIGARARPAYEGADSNRVDAIPYVRLYGEHLFARTTQGILEGGWRTKPYGGLVFGAQVAYEEGREADESAFLAERGIEDVNPGASLGLHAEGDWKIGPMPLNVLLRYRHAVESDDGAQVDLRFTAGILSWGRFRAGLVGQATWSDDRSTQRDFGVSAAQAAVSGLPAYAPGSGLRSTQAGFIGDIDIAPHWIALWGIHLNRLQGDASDSPLSRDGSNWYANAGVAYRF